MKYDDSWTIVVCTKGIKMTERNVYVAIDDGDAEDDEVAFSVKDARAYAKTTSSGWNYE